MKWKRTTDLGRGVFGQHQHCIFKQPRTNTSFLLSGICLTISLGHKAALNPQRGRQVTAEAQDTQRGRREPGGRLTAALPDRAFITALCAHGNERTS